MRGGSLNRRMWKELFHDKGGNVLDQALRTHYLYADEALIAEATQAITLNPDGSTSSSSAAQITTQYGPKPESHFSTGMLFIKTKNSNGEDTVAYDHLETPIQATDKAGNIVWAASYEAFGKATIITPQATQDKPTITSNLRLSGQYEDAETGLHYNYHRYYDPEIGRYITQDPIGLKGGINLFLYAKANAVLHIDPYGLFVTIRPPDNPYPPDTQYSGVGVSACKYYDDQCTKSKEDCATGKDTEIDKYACGVKKCCEWYKENRPETNCTRECLIDKDKKSCAKLRGKERSRCRLFGHFVCYSFCDNWHDAERTRFSTNLPPECKAAGDILYDVFWW